MKFEELKRTTADVAREKLAGDKVVNPMRIFVAILLCFQAAPIVACNSSSASAQNLSSKAISVEVWRGGDDGLTSKLADALEEKFRQTPPFIVGPASERESLKVTIPGNVRWKQIGVRTQVQFDVNFSRASRQIGTSKGVCWEDNLPRCAEIIVEDARKAALQ